MLPDSPTARALGYATNDAAKEQRARNRALVHEALKLPSARPAMPADLRRAKPDDRSWIGRWIRRVMG